MAREKASAAPSSSSTISGRNIALLYTSLSRTPGKKQQRDKDKKQEDRGNAAEARYRISGSGKPVNNKQCSSPASDVASNFFRPLPLSDHAVCSSFPLPPSFVLVACARACVPRGWRIGVYTRADDTVAAEKINSLMRERAGSFASIVGAARDCFSHDCFSSSTLGRSI